MCGRYVVAYDPQTLVSGFSLTRVQPFPRRWNVAPQSLVPVVYQARDGARVGELMRWGLVPSWAKEPSNGAKLNNARLEGIAEKPSFRQAWQRRRCILPASGFYEWQPVPAPGGKPIRQPWFFSATDAPFLAMAGLFEAWRDKAAGDDAPWLLTCCVITTRADALMAPVHERMPLMLHPAHWAAWLARDAHDGVALTPTLGGLKPGQLQKWPVSREVNRSSTEGEALAAPLPGLSGADETT